MMSEKDRRQRRQQHVQDESVIDHLMGDLTKPGHDHSARDPAVEAGNAPREYGRDKGELLQRGIRKEWTPDQGGLPDF
jgi:hypothetical protein